MNTILGLIMLYSIGHFFAIQHVRQWKRRTVYEKTVTVIAIASISLIILGVMFPN